MYQILTACQKRKLGVNNRANGTDEVVDDQVYPYGPRTQFTNAMQHINVSHTLSLRYIENTSLQKFVVEVGDRA